MVGGWTVQPDPLGNVFSAAPGEIYDKFIGGTGEINMVSGAQNARLRAAACPDPDDGFDHSAVLTYESLYTIEGGERLHNEPDVRLYFRRGANRVHVIAVMRRDEERRVVHEWVSAVARSQGLGMQPVRLKEDLPERHDELRAILDRFGNELLATRHPEIFQREGSLAPSGQDARYSAYRRSGSDRTWMVDIATVLADAEEHDMRLGAIRAFLFSARDAGAGRDHPSIAELRLHQRPGTEDLLRVSWKAGRIVPDGRPAVFTDEVWEELTLLDWTEEQKRSFLLGVWERVADLPVRASTSLRRTA